MLTTQDGSRVEAPLDLPPLSGAVAMVTLYNVFGELVVRAEQEAFSGPPEMAAEARKLAAGAAVGNLYWAQPLLDLIARDLGAPTAHAGWLVTTTQLGYAVGILLVVPLGDVTNRRRLVPLSMLAAAVALGLCALAPSFGFLVAALGLGDPAAQVTQVH